MTTSTASAIAFRCRGCWQSLLAPIEDESTSKHCPHCGNDTLVPPPNDRNIREASVEELEDFSTAYQAAPALSDAEINQIVRQETLLPVRDMEFCGFASASLLSRFVAFVLDGIFLGITSVAGVFASLGAGSIELIDSQAGILSEDPSLEALLILYMPILLGCTLQWALICNRGQTLGKLVCCIRIVTTSGKLPGFVRGVVLRNWVRNALGIIPFFPLLDVATIFGDSRRCMHDFLADTRVVEV